MRIGELAEATGLSRDTLRFYEERGLLAARRRGNGYRDYPVEAVEWLCYLRSAQALGFTLAEIEAGVPLLADPANAGGGTAGGAGAQAGRYRCADCGADAIAGRAGAQGRGPWGGLSVAEGSAIRWR